MTDLAWWAYGVASTRLSGLRGLEGRPVEAVERDGLVALASAVPASQYSGTALQQLLEDLDVVGRLAREHDAVLERAMTKTDVVPFRMCTLYATRDAIERMLGSERSRLVEALKSVHDAVELGVKAFATSQASEAPQRASTGREYLMLRMAQRDRDAVGQENLERSLAEVHALLSDRASAAVLLRPQPRQLSGREHEMLLNGAYLVPRREAPGFARLVESIARSDDLALEVTGPWPPYHFVGGHE
jgi:Gas vesicle synthesis protein GvpL/GvpF